MENSFFQRGGWWVVGQSLFIIGVLVCGSVCRDAKPGRIWFICGVLCLTFATMVGIAGLASLGRNLTPLPKPSEKTKLVQHGIYRWLRHPLYTAVMTASVGWSLLRQSWPAFAFSLGLAAFLDAKARREELWLRHQFVEYQEYEKRVRRFIPWIY